MSVKAILIDISDTLIRSSDGTAVPLSIEMVAWLKRIGIEVYLVSNNEYVDALRDIYDVQKDRVLSAKRVGGKKGTGRFVEWVATELQIAKNEILFLGDTDQDMREAVNGNVLFLRAGWSGNRKKTAYGFPFASPTRLARAVQAWFRKDKLWYFTLDAYDTQGRPVHYRALLNPDRAKISGITALLKENKVDPKLAKHLTGHLLGSVSLEGLHLKDDNGNRPIVCLYPGHAGAQTGSLDLFARISASLFKSDFISDLLVRHKTAKKSAFARFKKETVDFDNQLSTVSLNSQYAAKIKGRRVIVVDDFTTEGYGFETARNLLYGGGASEVYCISVGKYGANTKVFSLTNGGAITVGSSQKDFTEMRLRGTCDADALESF